MQHMKSVAILALLSALSGCYRYHTVAIETAPVGETVRARISASEAERLEAILGRQDRLLEGEVLDRPEGGLLLAVPSVRAVEGGTAVSSFQRISLSRESLLEVETRHLDKWRTIGAIAVATTVVTYAAISAFANSNASPSGGKGQGNQMRVRPHRAPFVIPLPFGH